MRDGPISPQFYSPVSMILSLSSQYHVPLLIFCPLVWYGSLMLNAYSMSEVDFCRHMLYSANITNKKKERMIQRVAKKYSKVG